MKTPFFLLLVSLTLPPFVASSANWPAWRGANAAGSTSRGQYAHQWDAEKNLAWKIELPAKGCSTPVVWEKTIYVTSPLKGQDAVLAFDWAGKSLWQTAIGKERSGKHRNGSGSNPSPIIDGQQIFAYFKSGHLAALDRGGNLMWKKNLQQLFGRDTLYWDIGTSPVLTKAYVVATVMHEGESFLVAYEKKSGRQAWKVSRNYECPVEGDHSYTTPIVIDHKGREAILVWGAERLTLHDGSNGRILWTCSGFNPDKRGNWVTVASPVVVGDMAVVPYGRGSRLAGIKLGGSGDVTETHRAWTRKDTGSFVPTPAVHDGKVYLLRDRGEVVCIDPKNGETVWKGQLPKAASSYYASPTVADGKLYATREDGVIWVATIDGEFDVLSENVMGERMIASPVPLDNHLLLRGEKHLFSVAPPGDAAALAPAPPVRLRVVGFQ